MGLGRERKEYLIFKVITARWTFNNFMSPIPRSKRTSYKSISKRSIIHKTHFSVNTFYLFT